MSATHQNAIAWIKALPLRWALGGLLFGLIWSLISALLQDSFSNPAGGHAAALFRVSLIFVLPLGVFGFVWGLTERFRLLRYGGYSRERLEQAMSKNVERQALVSAILGALFWLFLRSVALKPTGDVYSVLATMMAAAGVGALVGIFSKRNLLRKLGTRQTSL
jgi:hypothetical protein